MNFRPSVRLIAAVALACALFAGSIAAQTTAQPSAAAIALAKDLIELKGATSMFDPVVNGVIRTHKDFLIRANPNMIKELNEVETQLVNEYAPRRAELHREIAMAYAQHFTEQELKDAIAFYKSPLGKKLLLEEPKVLDTSMRRADAWAQKFANEVQTRLRSELQRRGLSPI